MAKKPGRAAGSAPALPGRDEIVAFLDKNPGAAGKRDIARAFGITGAAKIGLKRLLAELAEDGVVTKKKRRVARPGGLPPVAVVEIVALSRDGDPVARPVEWSEENGPVPRIVIHWRKDKRTRASAPGAGDRALVRLTPDSDGDRVTYVGRILKLLDRRPTTVLGVVRKAGAEFRLEPVDRKQRELMLGADAIGSAVDGDLVSVAVTETGRRGLEARVVEVIGSMASEHAVSRIAIHAHGIPFEFPAAAITEAEQPPRLTKAGREDWRDLPLVTIDPPDAKDHDDAVHAVTDDDPANPGGHVVTVAIADVGWYVRPGSALDREARRRGNSVYFPDRVVPMLPERISNDLCSLREGKDRPALAVRMVFAADGRKLGHRFHRILMRSAAKLSYAEAQSAFDGKPRGAAADLDRPILGALWAAYQAVAHARAARQPLELEIPERKVVLKPDGTIDRVIIPEHLEAHRLIEEFMIQANVAAAETLEKAKSPLVYRIHDSPSLAKLEALRTFLASIDVTFPRAGNLRPSHFNQILTRLKESEHGQLIHEVILRTQSQAEYSPENIGHFGLNLRRYAHFTSPIRRYADLLVHRALIRALDLGAGGLPDDAEAELAAIATEISGAERRAMAAERDTIDRLVAHWLADRIGANFTGRIAGVTRAGLFVKLDETGADGFVPISSLGLDYFVYDEGRHALVGRQTGETYRLGDPVEVRLVEVAPVAGALRFELLGGGRLTQRRARPKPKQQPGKRPPRGRSKRR